MKRHSTIFVSIFVLIMSLLAVSCGGSNVGFDEPQKDSGNEGQQIINEVEGSNEFPSIFELEELAGEEQQGEEKGASWLSHPNHLAPVISHLGMVDPGDPGCYLLKGLKDGITGGPNGPSFSFAIYQIHLGILENDLLDMKVAAQIGAPTDNYFAAIADFSSMSWDFYGPLNANSWYTDMTALGYDFTGGAGNMYIALIALPGESLHITDITLNFKDRDKPKDEEKWTIRGKSFGYEPYGIANGGADVIFYEINTGDWFVTLTDASGSWSLAVPQGEYDFWVIGNEMLVDTTGAANVMIDWLPIGVGTRLDVTAAGDIIYMGTNAAYNGSVLPQPLITANML